MKKTVAVLIIFISIVTSGFIQTANRCYALSEGQAMIVNDTPLYLDASGRIEKFYLDKSYFLTVTDVFGEFAKVIFMDGVADCPKIEGYVKLIDLLFFDSPVSDAYPDVIVKPTVDTVLFADGSASKPKAVISVGSDVRYLGSYGQTEKLIYVYFDGNVWYAKANDFETFTVPLHPEYLKLRQADVSSEDKSDFNADPDSVSPADSTTVVIIALLIIIGLAVLYFIVRPDRLVAKKIPYDDEE
ncbi:MAG: hypothetical protein IJ811_04820 [Clostridia bacterium]|nr:hypothetical protein [Clostridia bacterium]